MNMLAIAFLVHPHFLMLYWATVPSSYNYHEGRGPCFLVFVFASLAFVTLAAFCFSLLISHVILASDFAGASAMHAKFDVHLQSNSSSRFRNVALLYISI